MESKQKSLKYIDLFVLTHKANVLRDWRLNKLNWYNTGEVVCLYNELLISLGEKPVSKRWWERMESSNTVPVDQKRRWILHTILNIPPAYLGLQTMEMEDLNKLFHPTPSNKLPPLNLNAYRDRLISFWQNPYDSFDEALSRIYVLQDCILYQNSRDEIVRLLCEYLIAAANMQRAQGYLLSAEKYIKKAIRVAERKSYQAQRAKALYMYAYIQDEKWSLSIHQEPKDLQLAIDLAREAVNIAENYAVPPFVESASRDELAALLSVYPRSRQDMAVAKQQNDIAFRLTEKYQQETEPLFHKIDLSWHIITKAEMHLALKEPQTALATLESLPSLHPRMRRTLTARSEEAIATIQSGYLDEGLKIAESILPEAKKSPLHLIRMHNLYQSLRENAKYTKEPYVIKFGFQLLKTQRPDLFQ